MVCLLSEPSRVLTRVLDGLSDRPYALLLLVARLVGKEYRTCISLLASRYQCRVPPSLHVAAVLSHHLTARRSIAFVSWLHPTPFFHPKNNTYSLATPTAGRCASLVSPSDRSGALAATALPSKRSTGSEVWARGATLRSRRLLARLR